MWRTHHASPNTLSRVLWLPALANCLLSGHEPDGGSVRQPPIDRTSQKLMSNPRELPTPATSRTATVRQMPSIVSPPLPAPQSRNLRGLSAAFHAWGVDRRQHNASVRLEVLPAVDVCRRHCQSRYRGTAVAYSNVGLSAEIVYSDLSEG